MTSENPTIPADRSASARTHAAGSAARPGQEGAASPSVLHRRLVAVAYGLANHLAFGVAVTAMALGLHEGMSLERLGVPHLGLTGVAALGFDLLLLAQFPLLHSWLVTPRGRRALARLAPRWTGHTLTTTLYTTVASLQLFVAFAAWVPLGSAAWRPAGTTLAAWELLFVGAWAFLLRALVDGGFGLQTGAIGWQAVWRGDGPRYPGLPTEGLFKRCRQPIYLGFALLLWTGPVWTVDHALVAAVWTLYCVVGPRHKERRFEALFGDAFRSYAKDVPFFLPRLVSRP